MAKKKKRLVKPIKLKEYTLVAEIVGAIAIVTSLVLSAFNLINIQKQ